MWGSSVAQKGHWPLHSSEPTACLAFLRNVQAASVAGAELGREDESR